MNTFITPRAPTDNSAFSKAIHILSRPITLGAIALLFINDHLLRQMWPSWWTGKLGDLAWLFFTPFALAALLAWLIPARIKRQDSVVGLLAFGLTGIMFALIKSLPEFHHVIVGAAERLFGFPIAIVQDPTDLIALIALPAGWRMWKKPTNPPGAFHTLGWMSLPLAALLTIANTVAPDQGITCLTFQDERVVASTAFYGAYASSDGGLSWRASERRDDCFSQSDSRWVPGPSSVADPANPNTLYRYSAGIVIEKSVDGGQTWQSEFQLTQNSEAEKAYYKKYHKGNPTVQPGPFAALADPRTGNIIFAMGNEGVLVRQANGSWVWVSVGDYRHLEFRQVGAFLSLLSGEMWLALGFALLLIGTCGLRLLRIWLRVMLGIGWVLWGLTVMFSPARVSGYPEMLLPVLLIATAIFIIPTAVETAYRLSRISVQAFGRLIMYATAGLIAFLLPYVLWAINSLPNYTFAIVFALILSATLLLLAFRAMSKFIRANGAGKTLPACALPSILKPAIDEASEITKIHSDLT